MAVHISRSTGRNVLPAVLLLFAGLAVSPASGGSPRSDRVHSDIVFTEIPVARVATANPRARNVHPAAYGDGGRLILLRQHGSRTVLTPGFDSAADPSVSFDGAHILFAAKKSATDPWNIFEMTADGTGIRQITNAMGNCRSPIYQPSIFYLDDPGPMPQIAFVSDQGGVPQLYSARTDGSGVRRLTYVPAGAFNPTMLPDGRMVFAGMSRPPFRDNSSARMELFAVNIDGTDYAAFSGGQGKATQQMPCVSPKRYVIFVEQDSATSDGSGSLAAIDLRRNLHSYRRIATPPGHLYHSPSALPDGSILASRRPATRRGILSIVRIDLATGAATPIASSPNSLSIQAQAVAPRAAPDGRSSVVDEKQDWAKLYCLNVYESDLERALWPKGLVKRIRVIEGAIEAESTGDLPAPQPRFLGEINADDDGSFHIQIPPNIPVRLQALDSNGMALRSSSWIWAKNKEQRGCIGCHEDGERTPENVMATALTRPAAMLTLPAERRRFVEFETEVAPIFAHKCAIGACHGSSAALNLTSASAYDALLTAHRESGKFRFVTPGAARTSSLIWAIFGRSTSRPWDREAPRTAVKRMPPAGSAPLTDIEKSTIIEWIDLGAHRRGKP